jgi:hypothetical protein
MRKTLDFSRVKTIMIVWYDTKQRDQTGDKANE